MWNVYKAVGQFDNKHRVRSAVRSHSARPACIFMPSRNIASQPIILNTSSFSIRLFKLHLLWAAHREFICQEISQLRIFVSIISTDSSSSTLLESLLLSIFNIGIKVLQQIQFYSILHTFHLLQALLPCGSLWHGFNLIRKTHRGFVSFWFDLVTRNPGLKKTNLLKLFLNFWRLVKK